MLLFKCMGVNKLFLCTIQWWHPNECSNERCRQTTDDRMLKFLEKVKLGFIFIPVYFKIAKGKKTCEKSWKNALPLNFHPKCQFLRKRNFQFSWNFQKEVLWAHLHRPILRHQMHSNLPIKVVTWRSLYSKPLPPQIKVWWHMRALHTFFLDPKPKILLFHVEIRSNGIQKNCPKNKTKNDPSIAHSYF